MSFHSGENRHFPVGVDIKGCFDYMAYAASMAEKQGYCLTDDGQNYIRKRDSPQLEQQQGGMTMQ